MTAFDNPHFIDTNGIRMAVYEQGAGKPIVLCHGFPELAFSWRHQMQRSPMRVITSSHPTNAVTDAPTSRRPIEDYDIVALTGDLVGLLDHYGYPDAVFVGHDWGAIVVWAMAVLHPDRVAGVINLSVPFMDRGTTEWVGFWEKMLGGDFYIVHFNRQFGVADAAFARDPKNLLRNLYRTEGWKSPPRVPKPGMAMINLVDEQDPPGKLMMSEAELDVFAEGIRGRRIHRTDQLVPQLHAQLDDPRQRAAEGVVSRADDSRPIRHRARLTEAEGVRAARRSRDARMRALDSAGTTRADQRADTRLVAAQFSGVAA